MVIYARLIILFSLIASQSLLAHEKDTSTSCKHASIKCAKTITSAFSPSGDLWRVWSFKDALFYSILTRPKDADYPITPEELSKSVSKQIESVSEKISSRGENRPKIGFDQKGGVYISWAKKREKRFTADIRLIYSLDNGKSFSKPITINDDNLLAGHSFNEMSVNEDGTVSLIWLDSRKKTIALNAGKEPDSKGSSIYFAQGNPSKHDISFKNKSIIDQTCQCCRLAISKNMNDDLAIFWRQIYGDNIREFAVITLDQQPKPKRVSFDHWKIDGCPHQGGAISIDRKNRYHMVWFNQGTKGKGIFYSYSDDLGESTAKPLAVGNIKNKAAHPHMLSNGEDVEIVWLEINEGKQELWHQSSSNQGKSFNQAKRIAQSDVSSDRPFVIKYAGETFVSWQRPKQGHFFQQL